jgi:hypothetical protein
MELGSALRFFGSPSQEPRISYKIDKQEEKETETEIFFLFFLVQGQEPRAIIDNHEEQEHEPLLFFLFLLLVLLLAHKGTGTGFSSCLCSLSSFRKGLYFLLVKRYHIFTT